MGQGADRDDVHARLGDAAHRRQIDPARGLQHDPPGDARHGGAQVVEAEVVQHDDIGRRALVDQGQYGVQLIQPINLDLDLHIRIGLHVAIDDLPHHIWPLLATGEDPQRGLCLRKGRGRQGKAGREAELNSLLDELQINHVADQMGASLSGGERRRCEIARALAAKPRLILLDEPFAGVDPISVGEIQRIVTHLKQRGIGVLITDHNVRETLGICDRAYILNAGSVLAQGAPDALLANPDVRRVYLGETFRL